MTLRDFEKTWSFSYEHRCTVCFLHRQNCMCDTVKPLTAPVPVTFIMHHREAYKTTNTVRLFSNCVSNTKVLIRGLKDPPLELTGQFEKPEHCYFLNFDSKSRILTPELLFEHPCRELVVPDGNWRQAKRMGKREPILKTMVWVKLPPLTPSEYKLRSEHHPEGLSTFEAVARALHIIDPGGLYPELMKYFRVFVQRTLKTRPLIRKD
jgi:DTW domain-containing protein